MRRQTERLHQLEVEEVQGEEVELR
jgi:hypothetical protein